jgi:hypothetical protein
MSREEVKEKCGDINYRVSRTASVALTTETWTYRPFSDGVLSLHFEAGVVTLASSY